MEHELKDKDHSWPYVYVPVTCSPCCPGHPQFSPAKNRFTRLCDACYKSITKKNQPRLQTRSLPPQVIQTLQDENETILPGLGMVEDLEPFLERTCSATPLKRPRCQICDQRLSLCTLPCAKCKTYLCKDHTPTHPCA
jgi:hypothetical protein